MTQQQIRYAYVDVNGGQVHYRSSGRTGGALVCFHQTPLSSRMYERALPLLGARLRAFAFDTPGYGASTPLIPGPPTLEGYAAQLVAAMDAIGLDRVAVCGFATGAAIAVEVARQLGKRASHLVLSGTPLLSDSRLKMFAENLGEPNLEASGAHVQQVWDSRMENYGPDNDLDQVQMAVAETIRVYDRFNWGLLAVAKYDLATALRALDVPALFISAEHDKLSPENSDAASLVHGARELYVPNAQPQLCWTDPERFAEEVFKFVDPTG